MSETGSHEANQHCNRSSCLIKQNKQVLTHTLPYIIAHHQHLSSISSAPHQHLSSTSAAPQSTWSGVETVVVIQMEAIVLPYTMHITSLCDVMGIGKSSTQQHSPPMCISRACHGCADTKSDGSVLLTRRVPHNLTQHRSPSALREPVLHCMARAMCL